MKTLRYRGVPVIGFAAYSGSGKTTLMRRLIPELSNRDIRCAVVKHAHHEFDIDYPGKDSYELRKAGANQVLVGSGERWALVTETRTGADAKLPDFLQHLAIVDIDLILVEGFRDTPFPKIEVHRHALQRELFYPTDEFIIAIATDIPDSHRHRIPAFDIERVDTLGDFLVEYCVAVRND